MEGKGTLFSVVPRRLPEWLMLNWIPMEEVTFFVGIGGTGKDTSGCSIIRAVTRGEDFPDGTPGTRPAKVIYINPEDKDYIVAHRFDATGVDDAMVINMTHCSISGRRRFKLPDDLPLLYEAVAANPDVELVWISPLNAVASCRTTDGKIVRDKIIEPLQDFAEATGVAVVITHHVVKDGTIGGSKQLEDALRSIIMVRPDQQNEAIKAMSLYKASLTDKTKVVPLRYVIEGESPRSHVRWLPPAEAVPAADEPGEPKPGTMARRVLDAYRDADGAPVRAAVVAQELGIDHHTVRVIIGRLVEKQLLRQHRLRHAPARGVYEAVLHVTNGPDLRKQHRGSVTPDDDVTGPIDRVTG